MAEGWALRFHPDASGWTHGQPPGDTPAQPIAAEPAQARMRPVTVAVTSKLEWGRDAHVRLYRPGEDQTEPSHGTS